MSERLRLGECTDPEYTPGDDNLTGPVEKLLEWALKHCFFIFRSTPLLKPDRKYTLWRLSIPQDVQIHSKGI